MQFTDLSSERAILGLIVAEAFWKIPPELAVPNEAFHDPVCRIIYSAARALDAKGLAVCVASVNKWLEDTGGWRELQKAVDPLAVSSWTCWSQDADTSIASSSGESIKWALSEIQHHYIEREAHRIRSDATLTWESACEALAGLQANGNGQFDFKSLDERHVDVDNPPEKPICTLMLGGQEISSPGNLTTILAQAKAGKSAVVGAIIGALISDSEGDFLGWQSVLNLEGHAVIHFDTEQSPYDHFRIIERAMRRAGRTDIPPWLHTYRLADIPTVQRRESLEHELSRQAKRHKGILCVILDGVGDLALDTNNIEESNKLVSYLHQLAIKYNCIIVCILHENPANKKDSVAKARGHLGSELERKSEANVRLEKDEDGITTQSTGKSRHASISENAGPRFAFDASQGMHISVTEPRGPRPSHNDIAFVDELFAGPEAVGGFTWRAIINRIKDLAEISTPGAEKRLQKYLALKLITKLGEHYRQT